MCKDPFSGCHIPRIWVDMSSGGHHSAYQTLLNLDQFLRLSVVCGIDVWETLFWRTALGVSSWVEAGCVSAGSSRGWVGPSYVASGGARHAVPFLWSREWGCLGPNFRVAKGWLLHSRWHVGSRARRAWPGLGTFHAFLPSSQPRELGLRSPFHRWRH